MPASMLLLRVLLGIFTAFVILPFIRFKWSLLAYLVLMHFDFSGPQFASASLLGIENAIKTIVLPTALLLRTRMGGFRLLRSSVPFQWWIAFSAYVAIASFWTPFRISAIKQVGFLYAYTVLLLLLVYTYFEDKKGTYKVVVWSLVLVLGLALVQTYVLGNPFGGIDRRFTSFVAPQSFGLYLASILATVMATSRQRIKGVLPTIVLIPLLLLALYLNGSRSAILFSLLVTVCSILLWSIVDHWPLIIVLVITSLILIGTLVSLNTRNLPSLELGYQTHRTLQLFDVIRGGGSIEDIGTFRFRGEMGRIILNRIKHSSPGELIFGNGTSSTAQIVTLGYINYRGYDQVTIDANRVAHNEFLRVLYEWGLVGGLLFILVLATLIGGVVWIARRNSSFESYVFAAASIFLVLPLAVENILAASSTPLGAGIVIMLAQAASQGFRRGSAPPPPSTQRPHGYELL